MGYVGRFAAALPLPVSRGSRVICRTERGLEVAELLGDVEKVSSGEVDGTVLRIVTPSDDLLLARIEKHRDDAYRACALLLKEQEPDYYRISLRSRDRVDVSQIAAEFGGGGHAKASGCRIRGTVEQVRDTLVEQVQKHLS